MSQSFPNILFIDTQVADYQQLLDAVLPDTEVILINSNQDGIDAITAVLSNRTNLKSIQVISHGSQGQLQLGNTWLNLRTLQDYSAKIETWGNALTEQGDILFYGCHLAADEAGLSLIQNISQLTGADVAASEDLTGSALLGGDWDLEAKTGTIESGLAIKEAGQANYTDTLGIPSLTVYDRFLIEGYNPVNSDGRWNRITLSLSNYDQKSSFYIYYDFPAGLESQGYVSSNDYSDPNSGRFQITPSKVYSKNGQLLVDIPIIINNDSLWDQKEYLNFRLNPTSEYTVVGANQYNIFREIVGDNHPFISVDGNYYQKTEGESLRVKDITRIEFEVGDSSFTPTLSDFDLYLDITGTALRGSFANTQKGSDYKLFYTPYKRHPIDYGIFYKVDSPKAFPDPVANTSIYKINVPAGINGFFISAEDINDEVFEPTETIKISLVEDDVVLGLDRYSSGDKYLLRGTFTGTGSLDEEAKKYFESLKTKIVNLYENEPIVSLGKVVNPTEGFGYGSTIEGLEDAIAFTGSQSVSIPANYSLNLANTGKFTLEAWIFPNFTDNNQHDIISYQGGTKTGYPSISIINQTSLQIGFGDGTKWNTKTIEKAINPKGWNHVASTFDGKDYKIYVNAVEIYSTTEFSGQKPAPTQQLEIGKNFIGAIDEVRIWDTARSAGELQSLMISELTGTEAGLVGYWDFNKNLTNKAIQDTTNPHQGTINGTVEYLNQPAPQIGYVEVTLDKPFQGPQGLWVKYEITGGTATQNSDYFNSRYRKVSTDANSERNGIIIPQGETSAKIYFSALNDAVVEGDETVNIKLIPHNFDQENIPVNPNSYVLDYNSSNVKVFDSQGNFRSTFGSFGTDDGQFQQPIELVQDSQGNIYVLDRGRHDVQVFDSQGKFLRKFGYYGTGNGQFITPRDIALDNQNNIYVLDQSQYKLQVFDKNGTFLRTVNTTPPGYQQRNAASVAVGKNNDVYIAYDGWIDIFNNNGTYKGAFGTFGSQDGQFSRITNITIDPSGNIYAVDMDRYNVQIFDSSGKFLRKFGYYGTGNGQFLRPINLGIDGNGNSYVTDNSRNDVQVFDSNGNYLSKFGSSGTGKFSNPVGIIFDNWPNSNYGVSATNNSVTITIKDNQAYTQGVILFDATNQPISDKNPLAIKNGTADFKIKLTSQPTSNVTVNLSSSQGSLGNTTVTFTSSNWDTLQTVKLNGVGADGNISASAAGYFTGTKTFGFTINPPLKVTEGSTTDAVPVTPEVIISSLGDVQENGGESGNFIVNLSAPAPKGGININYTVSGTAIQGTDYQNIAKSSLKFDGVNDHVALSNGKVSATSLNLPTNALTLEAWVNIAQFKDWSSAISFVQDNGSIEAGFALGTFSSGQFYLAVAGGGNGLTYLKSPSSYSANQWYHIAGVYNGSKMELFINGESVAISTAETGNIYYLNSWYRLGMFTDDNEDDGLNGQIREVRVWNTARTQSEIIANKDISLNGNETGLVNYYQANPTTDNSVIDSSVNKRNGVLVNGASYVYLASLTIPEGETSGLIPLLPIADDVTEPNEAVTIALQNGSGYTVSTNTSKKQATLNILNDDTAGIKVVNAQKITDSNNNLVTGYSDNLVAVVTSEPYPNVNNVLQLWDNNNKLLGSVTLTQEQINAGKISLNVTGTLPNPQQLRAILKENSTVNQGLTLDNGKINLNGNTVEIALPSIGNQALVGIRLQSKPTADVTVSFKDIDNTETSLDKTSVTFTPQNWQEYQVVTVTGLDDLDLDGDISYNITAFVSATTDPNYSGKTFELPVKNLDDDQKLDPSALNTPSKINYTLKFDGLDDHVAISNGKVSATSLKLPTSALTVEAWVNIAQFKDWSSAISFLQDNGSTEAGFALGTMATGQFYLAVAGGGNGLTYLNSPSKYSTNQWYHIAGVYNGSKMELFINGESVATSTAETGNIYYLDSWYRLGMYKDDNEDVGLNGEIREVRVWNVARSGADIKANKNTSLSGQETGLINYYQGNLTTDNLLFDSGSNRQNGVLANGASASVISLPTVSIGNPVTVAESNTTAQITVNLSKAATQTTEVIFSIPDGTAVINQDYQISQTYLINQFETDGKSRFASPFDNVDVGDNAKPTFADLDNDGDLDAIIGHQTGIKYLKNVGSSSSPLFAEQTGSQNPFGNINIQGAAPTFADLNGDLTLDLAIGTDTGNIIYYINNGDRLNPRFVLPSGLIPVQNDPFTWIDVGDRATPVLVDYDKDGDNDLIVGSQASGISYYRNTGNKNSPTFTKSTSNPFANISGNAPILVDYDSDTDLDMFVGQANGVVTYWENNNGTFAQNASKNPFAKITNTASLATNSAPAVVDLNGDGFKDAFIGVNNGKIDYYEQFNLVTFNAGETSKTINLQIKDDQIAEGNETLDITLYPNTGYNLGSPQNYLSLDGTDDYAAIPNAKLAGDYTIETWVYIDSKTQNFSSILELGNDTGSERIFWGLRNNQSQLFLETITNSQSLSYTVSDQLPQKQWVHLAVSLDNSGVGKFYVNGELKTTVSGFKLPTEIVKTVNYLGKGRGGYQFAGKIKNLTIWDKSLTQTEIQADKDKVLTGSETGLVAYYKGDLDSQNALVDRSSNKLNGTVNNGALVKNDIVTTVTITDNDVAGVTITKLTGTNTNETNNSVNFDGQDDYVTVPNISKLSGDFTLETWVFIDSKTQNFSSILELGNDTGSERIFFALKNNQSQLFLETITNFQSTSYTLPDNLPQQQWVHLAVTIDSSGKGSFYVNGDLKQTASPFKLPTEIVKTVNYLGKGRGGYQFAGKIKNLTIWDKSLTQTEIQADKDKVLTGSETGLVAYYEGNLDTNNALIDSSTNKLNGTLNNGVFVKNELIPPVTISYSVKLNSQPIAPVTVYLGSQDESEALVTVKSDLTSLAGVTSLVFTPDNWNQAQNFYVKGVDDQIDDDDMNYQIITTVSSEDQKYHKLAVNDLSLTNIDNDQAGFIIKGAGKAIEGRDNVYSIKLSSQPVGDIRLIMTPTNDQIRLNNEFVGEPLTITFTPQNWNLEQTVRATALDDQVVEYLHYSQINFEVQTGQGLDFESKADNNTAENALDLGTIKGGYHWSNLAISPSGDIDWFKFTLPDTGNNLDFAKINFNHGAGNLKLEVYSAKNFSTPLLVSDSSSATQNYEQISLNGQPLGDYYLKISGTPNSYNLLVADSDYKFTQVVPNPVPVVIQDNDLPTATLIAGSTASEVFSEPSYFTVQLNAPLPTNSSGLNVNYRLVGGSATLSEDKNGNGVLDPGEDTNNNGKLELGDYLIQKEGVVRIAPGDIQNNLIIAPIDDKLVEDLKLTIKSVTPGTNSNELILNVNSSITNIINQSIVEPSGQDYPANNTTTGRLLVGDLVTGAWTSSGDQDWYGVYLEANKTYTFDLEKYGNGDPIFELFDSNSNRLGYNDDTANRNSRFTYTPTVSGKYYAVARPFGSTLDSYRLSVKNIVSNSSSKSEATGTDLASYTNTTGFLSVGDVVTGNIDSGDDQDGYKLDLKADTTYILDLMGSSLGDGTLTTPNIYLYNGQGEKIAESNGLEINGGRVQTYFTPTTSGTYYASALTRSSSTTGTYKLGLSEVIPYREPITSLTPEIFAGSKLRFDKNLTATLTKGTTLTYNANGFYEGNINVTVDEPNRKSEIQANTPARIAEETVIVELLPGDGYILPANPKATLRIQDDDVPGVRIVQVGDNTVVKEGETASFEVALLSEPTDTVTIRLTPGFEIDFVNPVNPTTVKVTKDIYTFDETNGGNLDVNLVSLVTGEKEKTVSFGVKLKVIPSTNIIVEFSDGNNDVTKDNPVFKSLLFTANEPNSVTGEEPGNWNQIQQVILGYLDPDSSGNLKVKAIIKDATTGQQIGNPLIFPIIRTTTQVDKQTTEITIKPEDWYKLQTVTFTGIDEQLAEPGLYHQSNISYQVNSRDFEYKDLFVPVQRVDVVDRPLNPESITQTVRLGLSNLKESLDNLELPMIGGLDGKMPNLIGDISDKLVVAISAEPELTGNRLKTVIENALSTLGLDFVNVGVDMTEDNIGILLDVKEKYDLFSLPLDVNLGLDALGIGLKTEGDLKTTFDYNISLGFGLNKNFGFYIDTKQTKVGAAFRVNLQDFKAQGNLAFLRLDIADDPKNRTELAITFQASLKDLDNYQTVKFFDVDGDYRLDTESFTYPIKTNNAGKPATTTTGEFITTNQVINEPFVNVNAQGIAPAFTTVANATAPQKLIDWNANGKFDAPFQSKNEGVYLTKKVASTTLGGQPTIESYYFDLNRNGSLDANSKEKLFSVTPGTAKWFDTTGKLKPFTIEQKNANGVVTYYFDQNGNNVLDTGETLTAQEKTKFDKNNNNILDADEAGLGEGTYVQGTGIAFLDTNNNGQLDATESYVYSEFDEFDAETEKKIITYNVLTSGTTTFLDQNNNGAFEEANDLDLLKSQPVTVTEAAILGLPGAGNYTVAQILKLTVANGKVMDTEVSFVNSKGDIAKKLDIKEEPLVRIKEGVRFIDQDNNGKLTLDNFDPLKSNIYTYKVLTSGTTTYLDQNNNGVYDSSNDLDLFANFTVTQERSKFAGLPAGSYPAHQILKLTVTNGQIQETEISFVNTVNAKTDTAKKLDVGDEPLLRTREGRTFIDNDNNGSFTLNDEMVVTELFTLPNNEFDTSTLTGTGNIVKLIDDGNRLTLTELKNWKSTPQLGFNDLFNYELAGSANLGLKTKTSVEGDPAFPSVAFDLAIGLPIFNYGNQSQAGSTGLDVNFNNLTLDFGTFLTDFATPIMKTVDRIISPVKPVIDILNTDTKLFSYLGMENQFNRDGRPGVSILDLGIVLAEAIPADTTDQTLKRIKDSVPKAVKFADTIAKIIELNENLIKLAESGSSIILPLGSYNLKDFKGASDDPADTAAKVDAGTQGTQTPAPGVTPGTTPAQQAQNSTTASPQQKSTLSKLQSLDGIQIPILDNPITLVRLLLGEEDVDLIKYDIPDLSYYFGKEQEFLLWTPPTVEGVLGLYFDAKTDLSVGYDTHGLESWRDDDFSISSIYKILDGFYVDDLNPDGVDKDELALNAGIYAGLSASIVVAKAVLKGGVDGYLGFDLVDEGELQGISDGKVRGSEIISRISNPLSLFDLKGSLDAYLKGEIRVGIDFGFFEIMKTVWEEEFRTNLAKFNIGANGVTLSFAGKAVDGFIVGGTVFLDGNLNGQLDEGEPFTFTNRNGQFTLNISPSLFSQLDVNENGTIDISEGRLAMIGGIDSGSDLPFDGILTAAVGSEVVTPFTSLVERVARLNPEGFTINQVEELVTNNLILTSYSGGLIFYPTLKVIATGEESFFLFVNGETVEVSVPYELDVTDQVLLSDNFDELKAENGWTALELNISAEGMPLPQFFDINPKTGEGELVIYAPQIDAKSYQYLLGAQIQLVSEQLATLTGKPINEILDQFAAKVNSGIVDLSSSPGDFFPSNFTQSQKLAAGLAISNAIATLSEAAYSQVDYNGDGISDYGYGFASETYDIYKDIFRINSKMQVVSENLQDLLAKIRDNELDISFAQFNQDFSTSGLQEQLNNLTGIAVNVFAPETADFSRTISEENSYTFTVADFPFTKGDPDDTLKSVIVEWTVEQGSLKLGDQFVTSGMEIMVEDIQAGKLTFNPEVNGFGSNYTHFNFSVTDGKFFTDKIHTMTFDVTAVDDAPTVLNPITDVNVNEDAANTVIDLSNVFTDIDNDIALIVKSVFLNDNTGLVTATIVDNQLILDYQDNQFGTANLTIRGTSNGKTVDDTLILTVNPVNDAPTLQQKIANQTATENQPFNFTIPANTFTDIDGDNLTYTLATETVLPSGITFDSTTGTFSGTPSDTASGTYNLTLIASDSAGEKANDSFSLNVLNPINGSSSSETINGTSGDDHINAGAGNDNVNGSEGNDILDGGTGNDRLAGGPGDDTYIVDSSRDVVIENGGEGKDTVKSSVNYTLTVHIEDLTLAGNDNTNGTGNNLDNLITGNSGHNLLKGLDGNDTLLGDTGNDTLIGGKGNDILTGGDGNDSFLFGSGAIFDSSDFGVDNISDFTKGSDKIILSKTSFNALVSAVGNNLQAAEFATINDTANELNLVGSSNAKIVYNLATGNLFYNQNGASSGLGNGALFANFNGIPQLSENDIFLQA